MSDFAKDDQEGQTGQFHEVEDDTQAAWTSSRRELVLPGPSNTISLSQSKDAPLWMRLAYKACIPCRKAVSRCDGHEYYTQACTQCKVRKTECTWALSRYEKAEGEKAKERDSTREVLATSLQGQVDGTPSTSATPPPAQSRKTSAHGDTLQDPSDLDGSASSGEEGRDRPWTNSLQRTRRRFRFPQDEVIKKGLLNSQAVPSAGWDTVELTKDDKGKGKAHASHEIEERMNGALASSSDKEYDAILSQLTSTIRGSHLLETASYTALLRSMFAEDASNLASSIWWWETSDSARKIRSRWKSLPILEKEEWKKMHILDKFIAENTYMWALWPRPPRHDPAFVPSNTIYPPAALDDCRFTSTLQEAILSTALHLLPKSALPDDIIQSATEKHIHAWTQLKRDYGIPASIQSRQQWRRRTVFGKARTKHAIPPSSSEVFAARHLDRDELVLDIIEETGSQAAAVVQHSLDSVLLKIAEFRRPKGLRRPLDGSLGRSSRKDSDAALTIPLAEGVGETSQEHPEFENGKDDKSDEQVGHNKRRRIGGGKAKSTEVSDREASGNTRGEIEGLSTSGKKKKKSSQTPANWEKVLLAAISVPSLPRSTIEATVQRLQAIYGPSRIAFLDRWDAIHAPAYVAQSRHEDVVKLPPPALTQRRREVYMEECEAKKRRQATDEHAA
ncbi:hypothetical protein P389DRAFT_172283 [Cystobasidium minutum MCA 4210]|uniref:uncharacterized protein n=1 Tax=Cystobasidium minutum MCA 4210 TaxID=1397322 RepID=UPI0034CD20C8|eukprot:jgi/Rhomi1/172283/fgenesh1_kg.4_\